MDIDSWSKALHIPRTHGKHTATLPTLAFICIHRTDPAPEDIS